MNIPRQINRILLGATLLGLIAACTADNYETGDGRYSYLRADFVTAHTGSKGMIDRCQTDDDSLLSFSPPLAASWADTPDTLYRALLYYNKVGADIQPLSIRRVAVLLPQPRLPQEQIQCDPLKVESSWWSKNRRYFNIALLIKTGQADSLDRQQELGLMTDSLDTDRRTLHLQILYRQNDIPAYYTTKVYLSVPAEALPEGYQITLKTTR